MLRRIRAVVLSVAVIGGLVWAVNALVVRVTNAWVSRDATQRARLALNASSSALLDYWRSGDTLGVHRVLTDIARDDQVRAAAICGDSDVPLVWTEGFPPDQRCADPVPATGGTVSILSIGDHSGTIGRIMIVHDNRFARLRVAQVRSVVFGGFALFGLITILVALLNRWMLNQAWARDLHRVLGAFTKTTSRHGMLSDVRSLAQLASASREAREEERTWTASRVREVVHEALDDAQVIVLANREPVVHERGADGTVRVLRPASGLVSAMEPVVRACSGSWVAHGSGSADREFTDAKDRFIVPPADEAYTLRRVWLSPDDEAGYYYGLANEGLWPLCHIAHARPTFRASDMERYRAVNRRFVDAVCEEATRSDPVILVQDYHFALAPKMLRDRMPAATIVTFWHVPWPNAERFGICPWRAELIEGLLGSTILGFHTQQHCNNFIESVDSYIEARIDRERHSVTRMGGQTLVRPYPISIEWPPRWVKLAPGTAACRGEILARHGLPPDALIGIGVDRLDYTKGLEERFLAVERALEIAPELRGRFTFIQIAAPSRSSIPRYAEFATSVFRLAERINRRFGTPQWAPIILLHEHHGHEELVRYYRAADFCYVSSLHDGMNLVAKEFVAARDDERGVLLLSSFTGAARELTEAIIVNPYDIDAAGTAILAGLQMSAVEQRERIRAMRAGIRDHNVFRWAGRMLSDAARERRRIGLADRLKRLPAPMPFG